MSYWLLKTEPSDYSYDDLEGEPAGTVWDGIRNHAALKYLRQMEKGDRALVYHTGNERRVVGVAEVLSDAYPDPNADDERRMVVDLAADFRLARPVPLADLRGEEAFAGHPLLTQPRLSAMEIEPALWEAILHRGGEEPGAR
jgi:predicted RNA-binding protein with PUA-like domain